MDARGAALLKRMRKTAALPVITKSARVRKLDERSQDVFALTSRAHDLYVLGYHDTAQQTGGGDLRATPYTHF